MILANRYQVVKGIGQGCSSRVFQCLDLMCKDVVCVKIVNKEGDSFDAGLSEVRVLTLFSRDDAVVKEPIIQLRDYFYFKEHLMIVTERLGETLVQHLNFAHSSGGVGINPAVVAAQAKALLKALKFIHSHDVIHCDIKPDNICLASTDPRHVKLIDFGSSVCKLDALSSYMQSRWYRAPEVILGIPSDFKIDLWALGCTLAEEVLGFPIFKGSSVAAVLAAQQAVLGAHPTTLLARSPSEVRAMYFTPEDKLYVLDPPDQERGAYKLLPVPLPIAELLSSCDSLMSDFIASLLQYEPENRPDASAALGHPFLASAPDPPLAVVRDLSSARLVCEGTATDPCSTSSSFKSKTPSKQNSFNSIPQGGDTDPSSNASNSFKSKAHSRQSITNFIPERTYRTKHSVLTGSLDSRSLWSSDSRQV